MCEELSLSVRTGLSLTSWMHTNPPTQTHTHPITFPTLRRPPSPFSQITQLQKLHCVSRLPCRWRRAFLCVRGHTGSLDLSRRRTRQINSLEDSLGLLTTADASYRHIPGSNVITGVTEHPVSVSVSCCIAYCI